MSNRVLKKNTEITIEVELAIVKEDDYYVAYCPALELSAYGNSIKKAKESFNKEVNIFIEETHKRGTLEKYLLKKGWTLQFKNYEPPRTNFDTLDSFIKSQAHLVRQDIQIPVC
jgi:hypothetical protein